MKSLREIVVDENFGIPTGPNARSRVEDPHLPMIPTKNVVISLAPIGTPLPSRPNPSLPPGYRAMNDFVSIPTQAPSIHFFFPGYNVVVGFFPTPTQVLSRGIYVPPPSLLGRFGPNSSNQFGCTIHPFTFRYHIIVRVQPQAGGKPQCGNQAQIGSQTQLGGQPQLGVHNPLYG
jgi:hypothetical protein